MPAAGRIRPRQDASRRVTGTAFRPVLARTRRFVALPSSGPATSRPDRTVTAKPIGATIYGMSISFITCYLQRSFNRQLHVRRKESDLDSKAGAVYGFEPSSRLGLRGRDHRTGRCLGNERAGPLAAHPLPQSARQAQRSVVFSGQTSFHGALPGLQALEHGKGPGRHLGR